MTNLIEFYSKVNKPVIPLQRIVALALATPACIKAQEMYLTGESPEGNDMMDRKCVADVVRQEAARLHFEIPKSVKSAKIANCVVKAQREAGIPVSRNGRIMLVLEQAA